MGMVVIGSTDSHPLFKKLMWEYFIDNPLSVGLALQENTPAITLGGGSAPVLLAGISSRQLIIHSPAAGHSPLRYLIKAFKPPLAV